MDFADRDGALRRRPAQEFPFAEPCPSGSPSAKAWADAIARYGEGRASAKDVADVPLDVRGSQFQRRIWAALRRIPRGETRACAEVARRIGRPSAARAVAQACAANPTPVVTPCHRAVAKDGSLGGYARGVARKRKLLKLEGSL